MNFAQIMGMLRLLLGIGGAAALTAAGFNGDAISHAVAGATTPGGLILGVVPIVVSGAWSLYAHTVGATVDRAVKMTGGSGDSSLPGPAGDPSPLAAPAAAAKARAGVKTHLSPTG
ncbi:MAG: hypothetical protein ACRYGG_07415 [Janthinobacterium lividum]